MEKYTKISTGTCEELGSFTVTSKSDCEAVAQGLGLEDTSAVDFRSDSFPHGCVYSEDNWLGWNSPNGNPFPNIPCGSNDGYRNNDCLCEAT